MSLDLALEFAHHLAVFGLVGVISAEFALLAPGVTGNRLRALGVLDITYGVLAAAILAVGFSRVWFGDAGPDFYRENWVFWTKIALFALMGLLSLPPTVSILRWRRALKRDPAFVPPAPAVAQARRFFVAEFAVLALIPIFAAMMARGIGH